MEFYKVIASDDNEFAAISEYLKSIGKEGHVGHRVNGGKQIRVYDECANEVETIDAPSDIFN
ncbi:hypothetical protein EV183_003380 [Coemansia sp. RSA 2336]|nr:hypothetical protein EV183_003380 [Coemansia sp. RSA 2336]